MKNGEKVLVVALFLATLVFAVRLYSGLVDHLENRIVERVKKECGCGK